MTVPFPAEFQRLYDLHLKHLRLKGLRPKTIEAYSRAVRRVGFYFDYHIENLRSEQLVEYFDGLLRTHSWSSVKHDLYGMRFFYQHVLGKPWPSPDLIKPPKSQRLPDILSVAEAERVFSATRVRSYRAFFFTLYSLGLRLGEGLRLQVGDIDAALGRVHIRDSKGNRDRFVPLPARTLSVLREFWSLHRNVRWLFPSRQGGPAAAALASAPLDRGGVQTSLRKVVGDCGLKKRSRHTAFATATPRI